MKLAVSNGDRAAVVKVLSDGSLVRLTIENIGTPEVQATARRAIAYADRSGARHDARALQQG